MNFGVDFPGDGGRGGGTLTTVGVLDSDLAHVRLTYQSASRCVGAAHPGTSALPTGLRPAFLGYQSRPGQRCVPLIMGGPGRVD